MWWLCLKQFKWIGSDSCGSLLRSNLNNVHRLWISDSKELFYICEPWPDQQWTSFVSAASSQRWSSSTSSRSWPCCCCAPGWPSPSCYATGSSGGSCRSGPTRSSWPECCRCRVSVPHWGAASHCTVGIVEVGPDWSEWTVLYNFDITNGTTYLF